MMPSSPQQAILYFHGFNSSPASRKAAQFREGARASGFAGEIYVPALPPSPAAAIALAEAWLASQAADTSIGLVGSSLGGFYACYLAERYGLRAALINPAMRAPELLAAYLGENQNLYTHEQYTLTPNHLNELAALRVTALSRPERLLLLLQTGDEVLDWRQAVAACPRSPAWVEGGGSHLFEGFGRVIPMMLAHLFAK